MALKWHIVVGLILVSRVAYGQFTLYISAIQTNQPDSTSIVAIDSGEITSILLHPKTGILTYTKTRNSETILYNYNFETKDASQLFAHAGTITSLQLFPDEKHFSFLTENTKGPKDLINLSIDGRIHKEIRSGLSWESFIWIDDNSLLYLESGEPNTLNLMTMRPIRQSLIAKNISATLVRVSTPLSLYFVHKLSVDTWSLKKVGTDGSIRIIADTLPEADVFCVAGNTIYLESEGIIYRLQNDQWIEMTRQFQGKKIVAFQMNNFANKIAVLASGK